MPGLDKTALASAIQAVFDAHPPTPSDCAQGLANAYKDYAAAALFGVNAPAIAPPLVSAMKATLEGAIATPATGSPGTFAAAWASAVGTFWTSVPVTGITQAGATTGCPGAASLTGDLTPILANLANTSAVCAAGIADKIDAATKTVAATVAPPPSTVLPIS